MGGSTIAARRQRDAARNAKPQHGPQALAMLGNNGNK